SSQHLILNFLFRRFKTEVLLNSVSSSCLAMRWRSPSQWGRIIGRTDFYASTFLKKNQKKALFGQYVN
ncbi:hypothetical protein MTN96_36210, partial [Pseudoalteromonas sp. 2CM28B]|nr:hypothetical protein [Pseudoalteromonas sp. 2CM28B]MDI3246337.1 hypothetical protein [Pseudoalteromonas agarivorans]